MDDEPYLDENMSFVLNVFDHRILRAIEFHTLHSGGSPYNDEEIHEEHMRLINDNRKSLERAGFDPNGYPIQSQIACHRACSAA